MTDKRKAKKMLPILYYKYNKLDEDDPTSVKLSNEIDYWEHIKDGRIVCIYTDNEKCTLCRYEEVCWVKEDSNE